MVWKQNKDLKKKILDRLKVLLDTTDPLKELSNLTFEIAKENSEIDVNKDYSVLEDLAIQRIIIKFRDYELDALWHEYNNGYFLEDTLKYKSRKKR